MQIYNYKNIYFLDENLINIIVKWIKVLNKSKGIIWYLMSLYLVQKAVFH